MPPPGQPQPEVGARAIAGELQRHTAHGQHCGALGHGARMKEDVS